ncbi:FAD-binding oxidoreductase [Actinokineospora terrae]|uniref:Glycolate oxidase n=1 Tax=Actinokineospora terrae TaxID=155974 RepID=A0A1H9QR98_9PSEU|nr:FAD-linked oxidase C-terminal domain-containing protein [Actinokineospora terrae]SER63121.1 glycolate oxidase [Actinokineospora terrae]
MADVGARLAGVVEDVRSGADAAEEYGHDEALSTALVRPAYVVRPRTAEEVAAVLRVATEERVPVTARGCGTGLSGGAIPSADGIVVSFERMNAVLEIDTDNHVAVVQPGVTLRELDERTAGAGLVYPVYPGELSASLGGNVATNAGGMRAVKYGVTRHHVLGLEAVLPTGEVLRTGGKFVKSSTGYDLTQLIVGSEGTLALVTEATLKLQPRIRHNATVLAPFRDLAGVTAAVPKVVASGLAPLILEYIDGLTMGAITYTADLHLGVPDEVRDTAQAYLVVMLENREQDRLDADVEAAGQLLSDLGAIDVYVLPGGAARKLVEARERAFHTAKAAGADDVIDTVVPRAALPAFMAEVTTIAQANETFIVGCGHAGDGNVHLALFQKDPDKRATVLKALFAAAMALGGAISGEHGLGRTKRRYFLDLEDPAKLALLHRIKHAFDPAGILNPGVLLDSTPDGSAAQDGGDHHEGQV